MFLKQIARPGLFQRLVNLTNVRYVEPVKTLHTTVAVSQINRMKDRKQMMRSVTERDDGTQGEKTFLVDKRYI